MQARHGQWITILSGYGATEAASTMCLAPGDIAGPGALGWPLPGHEVALVETDGCLEGPEGVKRREGGHRGTDELDSLIK